MDDDIFFAGVSGQAAAVRDGTLSARELVTACSSASSGTTGA